MKYVVFFLLISGYYSCSAAKAADVAVNIQTSESNVHVLVSNEQSGTAQKRFLTPRDGKNIVKVTDGSVQLWSSSDGSKCVLISAIAKEGKIVLVRLRLEAGRKTLDSCFSRGKDGKLVKVALKIFDGEWGKYTGPVKEGTQSHSEGGLVLERSIKGQKVCGRPRTGELGDYPHSGLVDVDITEDGDNFTVKSEYDEGLPSHRFEVRERAVFTKVVDNGQRIWEACMERYCTGLVVSHCGSKKLMYLKYTTKPYNKKKYFVKYGDSWSVISRREYRRLKGLLKKGVKGVSVDISDVNSDNVTVDCIVLGFAKFVRLGTLFTTKATKILDDGHVIWTPGSESEECDVVDICERGGKLLYLRLTVLDPQKRTKTYIYYENNGKWSTLTKEVYEARVTSVSTKHTLELGKEEAPPTVKEPEVEKKSVGIRSDSDPQVGPGRKKAPSVPTYDADKTIDFSNLLTNTTFTVNCILDEKTLLLTCVYSPLEGKVISVITDGKGNFWDVDASTKCTKVELKVKRDKKTFAVHTDKSDAGERDPNYYQKKNHKWIALEKTQYDAAIESMKHYKIWTVVDITATKHEEVDVTEIEGDELTARVFQPKTVSLICSVVDGETSIYTVPDEHECKRVTVKTRDTDCVVVVESTQKSPGRATVHKYFVKRDDKFTQVQKSDLTDKERDLVSHELEESVPSTEPPCSRPYVYHHDANPFHSAVVSDLDQKFDVAVRDSTDTFNVESKTDDATAIVTRTYTPKGDAVLNKVFDGEELIYRLLEYEEGVKKIIRVLLECKFDKKSLAIYVEAPKTSDQPDDEPSSNKVLGRYYERVGDKWVNVSLDAYNSSLEEMKKYVLQLKLDVGAPVSADSVKFESLYDDKYALTTCEYRPKNKVRFCSVADGGCGVDEFNSEEVCTSVRLIKKGQDALAILTVKAENTTRPHYFHRVDNIWKKLDEASYNSKFEELKLALVELRVDVNVGKSEEFIFTESYDDKYAVTTCEYKPKDKTRIVLVGDGDKDIYTIPDDKVCEKVILRKKNDCRFVTVVVGDTSTYYYRVYNTWENLDKGRHDSKLQELKLAKTILTLDINDSKINGVDIKSADRKFYWGKTYFDDVTRCRYTPSSETNVRKITDGLNVLWEASVNSKETIETVSVKARKGDKNDGKVLVRVKIRGPNGNVCFKYYEKFGYLWFTISKEAYVKRFADMRCKKNYAVVDICAREQNPDNYRLLVTTDDKTKMTNFRYQPVKKGGLSKIVAVFDGNSLVLKIDPTTEEIIRVLLITQHGEDKLLHVRYKTPMAAKPVQYNFIKGDYGWIPINEDEYNEDIHLLKNMNPITPPVEISDVKSSPGSVDVDQRLSKGVCRISPKTGTHHNKHLFCPSDGSCITSIICQDFEIAKFSDTSGFDRARAHHKAGEVVLVDVYKHKGGESSHRYYGKIDGVWYELTKERYTNRIEELRYMPVAIDLDKIYEKERYSTSIDKQDDGLLSVYFQPHPENRITNVVDGDLLVWENGKDNENCIYVVYFSKGERSVSIIFLHGNNTGLYYMKVANKWKRVSKEAYRDELYVMDFGVPVTLDINMKETVNDISFESKTARAGKDRCVYNTLGKDGRATITKVVDKDEVIWKPKTSTHRCTECIVRCSSTGVPVELTLYIGGRRDSFKQVYQKVSGTWKVKSTETTSRRT